MGPGRLPLRPMGDYCPHVSFARTTAAALLLALVLALGSGAALAATTPTVTERIFLDYTFDRVINGSYSATELQAALEEAQDQGAPFKEFESAVQDVYDRDFLGIATGEGNGQTAQARDEAEGSGLLPEPRGPSERTQPPWPFLAMAVLGAMLALAGAGSSIYRRVHR